MDKKSNNGCARPIKQLGKDEILLEHHQELREDIRQQIERTQTRETRGIASIALIFAYSFYADNGLILITLIPIIISILFINHMISMMWISRLARHIRDLEDEIDVSEFCWETKYGIYASNDTLDLNEYIPINIELNRNLSTNSVNLQYIPYFSLYLIIVVLYFTSIIISLDIVQKIGTIRFGSQEMGSTAVEYKLNSALFCWVYIILIILMCLVAVSYYIEFRRNDPN